MPSFDQWAAKYQSYGTYSDSRMVDKWSRRPYLLGPAGPGRYKNRHRFKRRRYKKGGRARRACITGRRPEKKFVDVAADQSPSTTGAVLLMSGIAQGDTESTRVGRKATITNIMLKGHIHLATEASNNPRNRVRICVVWDHSTNGALFAGSDVFNTAGTADLNSYRDLSLIGRFTVLFDKVYTMVTPFAGNGTANDTGDYLRDVRINIKCCIPIEFDASASTGAVTTQQVNSVSLLTFEESTTPATSLHFVSRIRYIG